MEERDAEIDQEWLSAQCSVPLSVSVLLQAGQGGRPWLLNRPASTVFHSFTGKKMVLLRYQNSGQQINFLLLQPKILLQQPNVLLIELNILLL